jgi:Aerotolerance regulator N-terminal/von Willebrand factor type A domain
MGFLAPWFLGGLLAVGLPVFVHLLRRQTTVPRPVSSLMFFERGTQSSVRHRRLRYLLLFALRALLVLLLALAFARPFLRRKTVLASDKQLVVVIDDSYSMNAAVSGSGGLPGSGTKLDEAKREALAVLAKRSGAQKAQVMALGGQMEVLTQPVEDAGELRAAVQGIAPGDGHGTFGELGLGMRAMAETVHTPMEVHLFSDMQQSNMPGNFADMVMPGSVTLVLHPVGTAATPNWTVESVEAPGQLVDPKKARVIAVVAGHDTPAATRTVSVVVNGAVTASKKVDVPANGRATVAFDSLDVPFGESKCAVKIDGADGFPNDDASEFAVKRADPERVLFVHQGTDTRSPLYFGAALGAAAQASFVLQPITPEQASDIDPTKYAFVVLSDVPSVPSILEHTLEKNVEDGGSVLVAAGTAMSHREHIPVYGGDVADGHYYTSGSAANAGFTTVGDVDGSHPAMRDAQGWEGAKFFYAAAVDPGSARVVARLADGTPLLIDKQVGEGHVLVFASGFDNLSNDLPLEPAFVAFVDRTARYLSGEERAGGARVVDSFVQLRNPANEASGAGSASNHATVDVIGPDGKRPLSLKEAAAAESFQLSHAGFYQIHFANGRDAVLAVNPDRRESDLEPIADDVLKLWSGSGNAGGPTPAESDSAAEERENVSGIWWWFMLALTMVAVAESIVAAGYLGTQREEA